MKYIATFESYIQDFDLFEEKGPVDKEKQAKDIEATLKKAIQWVESMGFTKAEEGKATWTNQYTISKPPFYTSLEVRYPYDGISLYTPLGVWTFEIDNVHKSKGYSSQGSKQYDESPAKAWHMTWPGRNNRYNYRENVKRASLNSFKALFLEVQPIAHTFEVYYKFLETVDVKLKDHKICLRMGTRGLEEVQCYFVAENRDTHIPYIEYRARDGGKWWRKGTSKDEPYWLEIDEKDILIFVAKDMELSQKIIDILEDNREGGLDKQMDALTHALRGSIKGKEFGF
jgi:hypothetical protein